MSHRILVVDDDEDVLLFITILLQQSGFSVLKAKGPREGLQLAQEQKPDLVLLDIMMPEMDGWEVSRRLREMTPEMPIVFVTAKASAEDRRKGMEMGDDYVVKPFDAHELVRRIREQLKQRAG
jgi:DNA-binding response OmpR family regulator